MTEASSNGYAYWRERVQGSLRLLPDKPEETVDTTLKSLWCTACGNPVSAEKAQGIAVLPTLDAAAEKRLDSLVERRLHGTPLAHITGRQSFMGLEMVCGDQAMIPRKETELLARTSIELLSRVPPALAHPLVIDTCTGCGNVALALARAGTPARVFASDLSPAAVALAQQNAVLLGLSEMVSFRTGDFLSPFETDEFLGKVSMITCNPPYISSAKVDGMDAEIFGHEPRIAFDGGPLGIAILARLLTEAPRFLVHGGWLCFEAGAGQGAVMARRVEKRGLFDWVETIPDASGVPRVVVARRGERA